MNGNEVFRNGISDGAISESSVSSNIYDEVVYRQISLPISITNNKGDANALDYIKSGSNTIAIGLVGSETSQNEVEFDCALRLMSKEAESRIYEYQTDYDGIDTRNGDLLNYYYTDAFESTNCANFYSITFNNDRREWINSLLLNLHFQQSTKQPRQFTLKARNGNSEEWTTISDCSLMTKYS